MRREVVTLSVADPAESGDVIQDFLDTRTDIIAIECLTTYMSAHARAARISDAPGTVPVEHRLNFVLIFTTTEGV